MSSVSPLVIGPHTIGTPVVLAPMAGITNVAFRQLCRQYGAGFYVCEMITTYALVERDPITMHMITFAPDENPRSLQLYGVDPKTMYDAVRMIVDEGLADHIDMNFGCPVPKVTRKGGGAALPYKRKLFGNIVKAAVQAAQPAGIPVTVKFRIGIDSDHVTYLDAGRIAEQEGVSAVALHARTAEQRYSGQADWSAIAKLKDAVTSIPVLGNGDIFSARDALNMVAQTGCDGVVIGRGCLGRPWLFRELQAAFAGQPLPEEPSLGEVAGILRTHATLLAQHYGEEKGMRDMRKHMAWYFKGFPVGGQLRRSFAMISSLAELDDLIGKLDNLDHKATDTDSPRGRQAIAAKVVLPHGWLADPDDDWVPFEAEMMHSGG